MTANRDVLDRAVDRAAMLRLYEARVHDDIKKTIAAHDARSAKLIVAGELRKLEDEAVRLAEEGFRTTKKSLLALARDQISFTAQSMSTALSDLWRTQSPRIISEDLVLARPIAGEYTLEAAWRNIATADKRRIEELVRSGMAKGQSEERIALNIRRATNLSVIQSKAIATTAMTSVTAQADHAVYKANAAALRGWQYVAVLDSRTTMTCAMRDGHIYSVDEINMLPPAHYNCRSTTVPVFKSWKDIEKLEGAAEVRRRNFKKLTQKQQDYYDGLTPERESYSEWLRRQPTSVQEKHLGSTSRLDMFTSGRLEINRFFDEQGRKIGIRDLRRMSNATYSISGDVTKFDAAKRKLDMLQLPFATPDDIRGVWRDQLAEYYALQAGELEGQLSLTNYRGVLMSSKQNTKRSMLAYPPREDQMIFNPVTRRFEDSRYYPPAADVHAEMLEKIKGLADEELILDIDKRLADRISLNERTVVMDNLRTITRRYRENPEVWGNFKGVVQGQLKFDVINFSDTIETRLRARTNVMRKLKEQAFIDPVLGPVNLQKIHDEFADNIIAKNKWEARQAPLLALKLRGLLNPTIMKKNPVVWKRLNSRKLQQFYLRFANRLALADSPDRDQLAMQLGRDLYNLANLNGSRNSWYKMGMSILEAPQTSKIYRLETFGVQKRRMKNKLSHQYYGPYYDTQAWNLSITDKSVREYADLNRKIDLALRTGDLRDEPLLKFREGYKTYFLKRGGGWYDTGIPITSTSAFSTFPANVIDENMVNALTWASKTKYKIDQDYFGFINKLIRFEDDKGKAKFYNELNTFKSYLLSRGDSYERLKAMEWLGDRPFSNTAFIDHRGRVYDRGFISPQSGETFRPFLNSDKSYNFSEQAYKAFKDQVGGFMGGLSDVFEGRHDSLTMIGRQNIAESLKPKLVEIGRHILSGKPNDIRAILANPLLAEVDGEDMGKFYRLAMEYAKIDDFLGGNYRNLGRLSGYRTSLVLEQDASSSGAQIIALTTRNRQLAELSNVVPTDRKQRLYDEIAGATFNDPRFTKLNERLGISERDLRKAAKAQNMVTLYGAGTRTGILNVEKKLGKALSKDGVLVLKAEERDKVLGDISAQAARYKNFDPETARELMELRDTVKEAFNEGLPLGDEIMEQLWFLQPETRDFVNKLSSNYDKVITPKDFKDVAAIMSEKLMERTPILMSFTKFFGRLAEDYLLNAKPSKSDYDWAKVAKYYLVGSKSGYRLPDTLTFLMGIKRGTTLQEAAFSRFGFWKPGGTLREIIEGQEDATRRKMGGKYFKVKVARVFKLFEITLFKANKLPKSWMEIPFVNFDGKVLEQHYDKVIEKRLAYKDKNGIWNNNILQVAEKTEADWWEQLMNESGNINDIADPGRARTAFGVNGNHSNDAVIVKRFHLWGKENGVPTSTIHDAFFTPIAEMDKAKHALRQIYADVLKSNPILATLNEMKARGFPKELYDKYLNEAIDSGLIPVPGRSKINGKPIFASDVLTPQDVLSKIGGTYNSNRDWYGIGP